MSCASNGHITKLKQSIFALRYLWKQHALENVNNCLNTNIYSYLGTSGGQSSNLYLNINHFLTPVVIRHLWQLKTVVSMHWYLICTVLLCQLNYKCLW